MLIYAHAFFAKLLNLVAFATLVEREDDSCRPRRPLSTRQCRTIPRWRDRGRGNTGHQVARPDVDRGRATPMQPRRFSHERILILRSPLPPPDP